jgi:hypothetical protein
MRVRFRKTIGAVLIAGAVLAGVLVGLRAIVGQSATDAGEPLGATLWVDTDGGTCIRSARPAEYVDDAACASLEAACNAAEPADLVRVKGGTYGDQQLHRPDCPNVDPRVVFRAAEGETVSMGTLNVGHREGPVHPASYFTLDGIDLIYLDIFNVKGEQTIRARDITLKNSDFRRKDGKAFDMAGVLNLTFENVDIGPICCNSDGGFIGPSTTDEGVVTRSSHITFVNVRFHDVRTDCAEIPEAVWATCETDSVPYDGSSHIDCFQTYGIDNVLIDASQFVNCQTPHQGGIHNGSHYWNWTVRNSFFEGLHPFDLNCGGGCPGGYAVIADDPDNAGANDSYMRFYYNTFAQGLRAEDWHPTGTYEIVGNLFLSPPPRSNCTINNPSTGETIAYTAQDHNMFTEKAENCGGKGNLNGTATFENDRVASGPIDLHLEAKSAGIDDGEPSACAVAHDIDGDPRPMGAACDIGADERE